MQQHLLQALQQAFTRSDCDNAGDDNTSQAAPRADAKQTAASAALGLLFRGKTLSGELNDLLIDLASQRLQDAFNAGGMSGQQWKLWIRSLRDIVASIQPELLLEGSVSRRLSQRRGKQALRVLSVQPGVPKTQIQAIASEMGKEFKDCEKGAIDSSYWQKIEAEPEAVHITVRAPDRSPPESKQDAVVSSDERVDDVISINGDASLESGETESGNSEEFMSLLRDTLRPGVWFRISREGSDGMRWFRLDRFDVEASRVFFASRDGELVHEKDAVAFLRDIAQGNAAVVHDGDEFERNLDTLIAQSQSFVEN